MKKTIYKMMMLVSALCLILQSCTEWTEPETVDLNYIYPWEREPQTWEDYFQRLRDYKGRPHYLSFAEFDNAPQKVVSEQDFMRCLPDSLDYVSLTNAACLSEDDRSDLELMHRKGTRVLYEIDLAAVSMENPEASQFSQWLEGAKAMVDQEGLDGWTLKTRIPAGDAEAVSRYEETVKALSSIEGKVLVYMGSYHHIEEEDSEKFDLIILNTQDSEYEADIKFSILMALERGIPKEKLLIAGAMGTKVVDSQLQERESLDVMSDLVFTQGPIAGLAVSNIKADYFHVGDNYMKTEGLIQKLNPSK